MGEKLNEQTIALPPALRSKVEPAQAAWLAQGNTRRLWSKDATLWTGTDEGDWLGWLDIIDSELRDVAPLQEFGRELRAQNFTDVLLLGMGGSSLGPEVLAKSFGSAPGYPDAACARFHRSRRRCGVSRTASISRAPCSSSPANPARRSSRTC